MSHSLAQYGGVRSKVAWLGALPEAAVDPQRRLLTFDASATSEAARLRETCSASRAARGLLAAR